MLLCHLEDVPIEAVAAASVLHPAQPGIELVTPGTPLLAKMLRRMKELGIHTVWINHDATADLEHLVRPSLNRKRYDLIERVRTDFNHLAGQTVSSSTVQTYSQLIQDFILELVTDPSVASLSEHLIGGPSGLFTHSANVAYLSLLAGIELESYIIAERSRLPVQRARDLTSLGVGAILHDIGKAHFEPAEQNLHELDLIETDLDDEAREDYRQHTLRGYRMLSGARAPASATQIVLNHHQRWNGTGFPDAAAYNARREGAPSETQTHVLARIVATANVLDNLLRDAQGQCLPPVRALHELASDRFEGWFDPVVRDAFLRVMPPFAVGSAVTLSDGRHAVVVTPNLEQPCRPVVRLLDPDQAASDGRLPTVELQHEGDLHIATCARIDVTPYLFTLTERSPLGRKINRSA